MRLGSTDLVNSVVICHPGPFTLDQVKAIKVPTAWVCAEGIYQILAFFFLPEIHSYKKDNVVRGYVFPRITPPVF